jgi:hypothetical protein
MIMRSRVAVAGCALVAVATGAACPLQPAAAVASGPAPMFGVAVDTMGRLGSTVSSPAAPG